MPGEDEIGYGKPPRHTRFRKGRSGNPKGRPKGARNLKTELEEELQEQIVVREGGSRREVSKQRAMVKSLMAKAVQGDARAAAAITNMIFRLLPIDPAEVAAEELGEDDLAILAAYEQRIRGSGMVAQPTKEAARPDSQESQGRANEASDA